MIGGNPHSMPCAYMVPVDNFKSLAEILGVLGSGLAVKCARIAKARMAEIRGLWLYIGC